MTSHCVRPKQKTRFDKKIFSVNLHNVGNLTSLFLEKKQQHWYKKTPKTSEKLVLSPQKHQIIFSNMTI